MMKMQLNVIPIMKNNKLRSLIVLILITAEAPAYCLEQSDIEVKLLFLT